MIRGMPRPWRRAAAFGGGWMGREDTPCRLRRKKRFTKGSRNLRTRRGRCVKWGRGDPVHSSLSPVIMDRTFIPKSRVSPSGTWRERVAFRSIRIVQMLMVLSSDPEIFLIHWIDLVPNPIFPAVLHIVHKAVGDAK